MRTWKPTEQRRIVRDLLILTILAWATQTLLAQWGLAAEAEEKFVSSAFSQAIRIEIASNATIAGADIRFKDIARWGGADDDALREAGEIVIHRFKDDTDTAAVDVRDVKQLLTDAGVNLGLVSFSGSLICKLRRDGDAVPEVSPLLASNVPAAVEAIAPRVLPDAPEPATLVRSQPLTLRDVITQQLSAHLGLPPEQLQVRFDAKDEKLGSLREGAHQFQIAPQKSRRLGNVAWDVTVSTGAAKKKHVLMTHVQAWQTQLVTARPISVKQVIQHDDVVEKRVLVDYLSEEPPVARAQIVGQQAARELPIGTVVTPRVIHSVQLVRVGQLVTVVVENGRVHVKWVAEARENGNYGQMIRVRKPGTRDEFIVVVSGPEQTTLRGGGAMDATADARR
jgi:flagella basal body P-ring formation protein FlgA